MTYDSVNAEDWPQLRGASSDGVTEANFPQTWTNKENVRWKVEIPGEGWSCPVIWGMQVIVTAARGAKQVPAQPRILSWTKRY